MKNEEIKQLLEIRKFYEPNDISFFGFTLASASSYIILDKIGYQWLGIPFAIFFILSFLGMFIYIFSNTKDYEIRKTIDEKILIYVNDKVV